MSGYSLEYILDGLTLLQLMLIHKYGLEFEETKTIILMNKIAECFFAKGKKSSSIPVDKPPPKLAELQKIFGDRVKPIIKNK